MTEVDDFQDVKEFLYDADEAQRLAEEEGTLEENYGGLFTNAFDVLKRRLDAIPTSRICPGCGSFVFDYRSWILPANSFQSAICRSCVQVRGVRSAGKEVICKCITGYGLKAELREKRHLAEVISGADLFGARGSNKLKLPSSTWYDICTGRTPVVAQTSHVLKILDYFGNRLFKRTFQTVVVNGPDLKDGLTEVRYPIRRLARDLDLNISSVRARLKKDETIFNADSWEKLVENTRRYGLVLRYVNTEDIKVVVKSKKPE